MNTFEAFQVLDIRTGTIVGVEDIPEAKKPIYQVTIDFGELGQKISAAGLKPYYSRDELAGKRVVAIVNFPPKLVAGITSECMLLAANDEEHHSCILLEPDKEVPNGLKIF